MKKVIVLSILSLFLLGFFGFVNNSEAVSRIKGYTTKKGTYVMPYYRSSKDSSRYNNYSTKGNYNPYTGKKGYTSPYKYKW